MQYRFGINLDDGRDFIDAICRSGGEMIWGIFLGTAAMGFPLLLVTAIQVAKLLKKKSDEKPNA
ncbi:MAG TPA: hypothetical protein VEC99_10810 [Clostridia bacterium]|nr:hypothetical protein [Clostridia bacterium]